MFCGKSSVTITGSELQSRLSVCFDCAKSLSLQYWLNCTWHGSRQHISSTCPNQSRNVWNYKIPDALFPKSLWTRWVKAESYCRRAGMKIFTKWLKCTIDGSPPFLCRTLVLFHYQNLILSRSGAWDSNADQSEVRTRVNLLKAPKQVVVSVAGVFRDAGEWWCDSGSGFEVGSAGGLAGFRLRFGCLWRDREQVSRGFKKTQEVQVQLVFSLRLIQRSVGVWKVGLDIYGCADFGRWAAGVLTGAPATTPTSGLQRKRGGEHNTGTDTEPKTHQAHKKGAK